MPFIKKAPITVRSTATNSFENIQQAYERISGAAIVKQVAIATTNDTDVTAGYDGYIIRQNFKGF